MGRGGLLVACGDGSIASTSHALGCGGRFWHVGPGGLVRYHIVMLRIGLFVACKDPGTILGLDPVWPQKALRLLTLHCRNDDFGAQYLRKLRELTLGLDPVWPQSGSPLLNSYYGNDDLGILGLRRPRETPF